LANSSCRWSPIVATSQKIEEKKKKKNLASILHVGCWLTLAITQELHFIFPPNWRNLTKNQTKTELHCDLCLNESHQCSLHSEPSCLNESINSKYIVIRVWMNPRM
jgi:hypothetical protein